LKLKDYKATYPKWKPKPISDFCKNFDTIGYDLIASTAALDPCKRISARTALKHVR
jgi:cyclin-dependent kinase